MDDRTSQRTTPISDLKIGKVQATDVLYFTGGLIAIPVTGGGVAFGPVDGTDGLAYAGPMSFEFACGLARKAGSYFVGVNQIHAKDGPERSEFWYPTPGNAPSQEQSSDSWAAIAHQAHEAQDETFADIARYLSISMRSAGWRLREVSRLHHEQLQWSLLSARRSGSRFSNVPIFDLYLAVHSLVAEMCAARDYLAQVAAMRVVAKPGTDSLARLCSWLEKAANAPARRDPMVALLLAANGSSDAPKWLAELGEMRNTFMHRQPMAANPDAAALLYRIVQTRGGPIPTIRLSRFSRGEPIVDGEDPFVSLLRHWHSLEELSRASIPFARYSAVHPHFSAAT